MGFRPVKSSAKPRPLVLALLAAEATSTSAIDGADVVLVRTQGEKLPAKKVKELDKAFGGTIWGVWLEAVDDSLSRMAESGIDFVAFPPGVRLLPLLEAEKLGRIMIIDPGMTENLLRSLDSLDIGAVIVSREPGQPSDLSWRQLMMLQRVAETVGKPLLVFVTGNVSLEELKTLWAIGIEGVVVDVAQSPEALASLRALVDGAEWTTRRRRGRMALVPSVPVEAPPVSREEPEEPDEDV